MTDIRRCALYGYSRLIVESSSLFGRPFPAFYSDEKPFTHFSFYNRAARKNNSLEKCSINSLCTIAFFHSSGSALTP